MFCLNYYSRISGDIFHVVSSMPLWRHHENRHHRCIREDSKTRQINRKGWECMTAYKSHITFLFNLPIYAKCTLLKYVLTFPTCHRGWSLQKNGWDWSGPDREIQECNYQSRDSKADGPGCDCCHHIQRVQSRSRPEGWVGRPWQWLWPHAGRSEELISLFQNIMIHEIRLKVVSTTKLKLTRKCKL